jgi:hypothetical protein
MNQKENDLHMNQRKLQGIMIGIRETEKFVLKNLRKSQCMAEIKEFSLFGLNFT